MLVEIINQYDQSTKDNLIALWQELIKCLATHHDPKKIISFLSKCAIIGIDEKEKTVRLGIPNQFVEQQVKKFFAKDLTKCIKQSYHPQYSLSTITYHQLQNGDHDLQIDLKKVLKIKEKATPVIDESTKAKLENYFGILFESKYRFDNFVEGANSQLAVSAAEAVANSPGEVYNPLFLYGDVGLGKTHLMQAIGNQVMTNRPDFTVVYLPTTKFIDHIIKAIRYKKLDALMRKLDEVDVLMLDDIQFLAGKEKTQEIFHNVFNDFHSKHKQIVVTSDQPPKSLTLLAPRLQSRFALGLVADIKPPDHETRMAILETKLKPKGESLDPELLDLIAKIVDTNVRELEGALNLVLTKKWLLKDELSSQDVFDSLATLGFDTAPVGPTPPTDKHDQPPSSTTWSVSIWSITSQKSQFDQIVALLAQHYGITTAELIWPKRTKAVSSVRQMAIYIAKTQFAWTLEKIWAYFGGRNHASIIYSLKTFKQAMKEDNSLTRQLRKFVQHTK